MNEIWKDIEGYEGLYRISNLGNIKSLSFRNINGIFPREKILKPSADKDGYLRVTLCKSNVKKMVRIHIEVAKAFIKNNNNYPYVNHKNEIKNNNISSNLEWCTAKYNTSYGNGIAKRSLSQSRPINQLTLNMDIVKTWSGRSEIERVLGYSGGNITSCCQGKRKTANGYIWRYAEELSRMMNEWGK